MSRKREVVISQDEDIISYEHNLINKTVRVLVGVGASSPDGEFIALENQTFESYIIEGEQYNNLLASAGNKPSGVFRREDLWPSVDLGREAKIALRERIRLEKENVQLANNSQERI